VTANQALFATTTLFDTESGFDFVTVAGTAFSGTGGFRNLAMAAGDTFTWSSDGSVTGSGFIICPSVSALFDPPPSPPAVPRVFSIIAGSQYCHFTELGCITDGADTHGNNEQCTVMADTALSATSTFFDTESGFDVITIAGTTHSGTNGFRNVAMAAGDTFTWSSDGSVTRAGFIICPNTAISPSPPPIPPGPTPPPAPTMFHCEGAVR
jgi:hypothetical protein